METGQPSRPITGRTSTGPSVNTPRTTVTAPSPMSGSAPEPDADRPATKAATPAPASSPPATTRPADGPCRSTATSRNAAIGRVRPARTAGAMADSMLTTTPTTNATTTVPVDTT